MLKRIIIICLILAAVVLFVLPKKQPQSPPVPSQRQTQPTPIILPVEQLPVEKTLHNDYQIFQTFNNCGPASLSMALSYFGIHKSQEELGEALRPYQNPEGDNDDKSVTLAELGQKAKEYGLITYHRPNGNIELIKRFIAADIPIITRTWLHEDEDIGHFRVVKGYNDETQELIQDDSFQGHNIHYSYQSFTNMWQKFNYEYLVLVPKDKQEIAEKILADDLNEKKSWEKAVNNAQQALVQNPENMYDRFNLSVAYYNIGNYQRSVEEFEKVETQLPFRTLWYQIEPIGAYFKLGQYDKVFTMTDQILQNQNRAFAELYMIRGKIYEKQGNEELARQEFDQAALYNKHLKFSF